MILGFGAAVGSPIQAQTSCRPASPSSNTYLGELKTLAVSTDSIDLVTKVNAKLPTASEGNVTFVTDSRTCDKAVAALNTAYQTPGLARQVYVFKFGNNAFVAMDPALPDTLGGRSAQFIFNKQWALQDTWVNP
jgi:hypothetical protein